MLGHKDIRTTQHYAKTLDVKVGRDMVALKEKLSTKKPYPKLPFRTTLSPNKPCKNYQRNQQKKNH